MKKRPAFNGWPHPRLVWGCRPQVCADHSCEPLLENNLDSVGRQSAALPCSHTSRVSPCKVTPTPFPSRDFNGSGQSSWFSCLLTACWLCICRQEACIFLLACLCQGEHAHAPGLHAYLIAAVAGAGVGAGIGGAAAAAAAADLGRLACHCWHILKSVAAICCSRCMSWNEPLPLPAVSRDMMRCAALAHHCELPISAMDANYHERVLLAPAPEPVNLGCPSVALQLPGMVEAGDMTDALSRGHWGSYNVPSFPKASSSLGMPRTPSTQSSLVQACGAG